MIGEGEERRINESVARAFNEQYIRHYGDLFAGTGGDIGPAIIADQFLLERAMNIDSFMRVFEGRSRSRTAAKHRPILAKAAILSIANGDFAMSELGRGESGRDQDNRHTYTDRQRQRLLHGRYKDTFIEPGSSQRSKDGRMRPVSSTFSESAPSRGPSDDMARAYMDVSHRFALSRPDRQRRVALNSFLRFAFPQVLEETSAFRDECRAVFESMGRRDDRIDFLREQLVDNPRLLDVFYAHITSILDLEWFRAKSGSEQDVLLKPAPKTRYGRGDAGKARRMLAEMYGFRAAFYHLDRAGAAFLQFGRPSAAAWVYGECLKLAETDMDRGTELQNAAAAYRTSRNFKLALTLMKKALTHFEATGNVHRICNALQLIGENQWRLGFMDAAERSFAEVERRGMEMVEGERWICQHMLGMTFGRLGDMRRRRRHLTRALELIPEGDAESALRMCELIRDERPVWTDEELPPALENEIDSGTRRLSKILYGDGRPDAGVPDGTRDPVGDP